MSADCAPPSRGRWNSIEQAPVQGVLAFHYRAFSTFGETQDETHLWLAPALDCFELQKTVFTRQLSDNSLMSTFEKRPVGRLTIGEPAPELFAVPLEYPEVRPSELQIAVQESWAATRGLVPRTPPRSWLDGLARQDEAYSKGKIQ